MYPVKEPCCFICHLGCEVYRSLMSRSCTWLSSSQFALEYIYFIVVCIPQWHMEQPFFHEIPTRSLLHICCLHLQK